MRIGYSLQRMRGFAGTGLLLGISIAVAMFMVLIFLMRALDGAWPPLDFELLSKFALWIFGLGGSGAIVGGLTGLVTASIGNRIIACRILGGACLLVAIWMVAYAIITQPDLEGLFALIAAALCATGVGGHLVFDARQIIVPKL